MFETFEHTADLGLRIQAPDLNQLFAEAARALFSTLIVNLESVHPVEEQQLSIAGNDIEELLHDWLSELLFIFEVNRLILIDFEVQLDPPGLKAIVRGERIDLERHECGPEIKAITWHELKVLRNDQGWMAEVLLDL